MSQPAAIRGEIRQLDSGYARETRALLFRAYRNDPTFAYVFNSQRSGFENRIRETIRQLVKQHFLQNQPGMGLFIDDRLVGVALIAPPQRRLGITESWAWRLRMVVGTGLSCTQRYLAYYNAVLACVPSETVHVLPLIGLEPEFQGQKTGQELSEQLLQALHDWCSEDENSEGIVLDTGNPRYLEFYKRQGYQEVGEIAVGPVREHVFFHPNPKASLPIHDVTV
ncbi:GNAT family N-acetyltransferase [Pseudomonas alliivorans]|uniref:GNAT family N-acetyltransferase n=1 Tax=Pseudomonas alliivorans TaxID=2810613 RepID=A0ABS4C2F9_9PSED|nr:GNAT family N-acetyltransferase [Pseudomonas alliivorans]MBP0944832.1 GNAT family N-acetyltransferase [Pseudomonas alliivorans]MEE4324723.1 GNAT family N-acetyltransferase [Pseudomonas alliivorans]MEE4333235.1 GNAT family N-acetyltransferase [Pseudomonas alliivorans]MEE4366253.1 GNAT family N-acetyltransferase [Pseudomonas alliivorans]MEE4371234.1 GNAT family N-acetyltransferase [Pseudomonas alliivorans]